MKTIKTKYIIRNEAGLYHNDMFGWVLSKDRATRYNKRPNLGLSLEKLVIEEV